MLTITKKFLENHIIPTGNNSGKTYKELFDNSYKINNNGCWEWNRWMYSNGYGGIPIKAKKPLAHRISYILYKGKIKNNLQVLHKCDNRKCVNPNHLFLGTQKDNMQDAITKNRMNTPSGETNGKTSLTEKQVLEMRKYYLENDIMVKDLAEKYNITPIVCSRILNRKRWIRI